jgi:hypothetical protein
MSSGYCSGGTVCYTGVVAFPSCNSGCPSQFPYCYNSQCAQCLTNADCASGHCAGSSNRQCVQCEIDTDCLQGQLCKMNKCWSS